jgi:uncharacterized Rmd1/YagE family protein
MAASPLEGRPRIAARAWCVGARVDLRPLESGETLARAPLSLRAGKRGCAVLFRWGGVVLFDLEPLEQVDFLRGLAPLVTGAFEQPATEDALLSVAADDRDEVDASGVIGIRDAELGRLQVVAEILAKSAVLTQYEQRIADVFEGIEPLAQQLRTGRGRSAPDRELLRQIGDVLLVQARTVGRAEVTEKPELVWDRPDLDRLYERLRAEYELRERAVALDRKLAVVSDTAETLLDLLQNRRALRVEWYIVILIAVEIAIVLYDVLLAR